MTNLSNETQSILSELLTGYVNWLKTPIIKDEIQHSPQYANDICDPERYLHGKEAQDILNRIPSAHNGEKCLPIPAFVAHCYLRSISKDGFNMPVNMPISYWGMAMMGEGGELCNLLAKIERVNAGAVDAGNSIAMSEITKEKLAEEIGGIVIYLAILSRYLGIDLETAMIDTFNAKSEKIGYPVKLQKQAIILKKL